MLGEVRVRGEGEPELVVHDLVELTKDRRPRRVDRGRQVLPIDGAIETEEQRRDKGHGEARPNVGLKGRVEGLAEVGGRDAWGHRVSHGQREVF